MKRLTSVVAYPASNGIRGFVLVPLLTLVAMPVPAQGQDGAREYAVDTSASHIIVVTHRSGLLRFLGHQHAILATDWSAALCFDPAAAENSRATITVDTRSLVIDSDSVRALAGLGRGPGEGDRREIQTRMLDEAHLGAEQYPEMQFESAGLVGRDGPDQLTFQGRLEIRGVEREVEVPISIARLRPGTIRFAGTLRVRQSEFGIRPESVAGVVRVSDPVDIHFSLLATEVERNCSATDAASVQP